MRVERVPCIGKLLEDIQLIEAQIDADLERQRMLKELIEGADCVLFLWDSFASLPSSAFFDVLISAQLLDSRKTAIVLNRVIVVRGLARWGWGRARIISCRSRG